MANTKTYSIVLTTSCSETAITFADDENGKFGRLVYEQLMNHQCIHSKYLNDGEYVEIYIPHSSVSMAMITTTSVAYVAPADETCPQ